MSSIKKKARVAGLLYLLMGIPAWFSLMYVPGKVIVRGNATATVANLLAFESLFRLGVVSSLVSTILFLFLALALYRLFQGVSRQLATLLVILVLVQVPMAFLNEVSSLGALVLARGGHWLSAIATPQRDALVMSLLNLHSQGVFLSQVFWGLWLFPLGLLVIRSALMPQVLGVCLIINGIAYVSMSATALLQPDYYSAVFRSALPALLGEAAMMLWLLIVGARPRSPDSAGISA
jgi:Domain of unknown function (DUF4386)